MEEIIISITKKEVETRLITSLLELLSNEGFVLKKKDKSIVRKTLSGFEDFHFRVLNYWPYCTEIETIGFSIRFNAVEEIIIPIMFRNGLLAGMEFAKMYTTVGDWCRFNIKIFNEKDLDKMKITYRQIVKPLDGMEKETFAAYDDLVECLSKM